MTKHNLTPEQERDVESHAPYLRVFWGLLILTILEYVYARMPLAFAIKVAGLATMASLYAFLVAWFFMHLKFEGRWVYLMLVPVGILTVVVVAGLTPDIAYHEFGFYQSAAVADR